MFHCLCSITEKENLQLENLKGFASDGASVKTGKYNGVAAKFKELESCKTMINIHCIGHLQHVPPQVMHLNLFRNLKKQCLTYRFFLKILQSG